MWLKAEPQYNTETWYCYNKSEPDTNDSIMEEGKLTITDKGVSQKQPITFCARKSFLLGSNTYFKWSNSHYFYVKKVSTIPQPVVTLKVDGEEIEAPASGSTIYFNDSVTATIKKTSDWPLDVVPGSKTDNAAFSDVASRTFRNTVNCEFKSAVVDSSGEYTGEYSASIPYKFQKIARNKLWLWDCTATVDGKTVKDGDLVAAGKTVTINPTISAGYTFKGWYSTIDNMPITDHGNGTYSFTMPDQSITIRAILYAQEYDSVEVILTTPSNNASVDTATCKVTPSQITAELQWYKGSETYHGSFVSTEACYRIHIICHAAEGAIFSDSATIKVNRFPDKGRPVTQDFTLSDDKKTLEFDAWLVYAPEITIPLHEGETPPTASDCILPPGLTVETLTWNANGTIKELRVKEPHYTFGDTICRFSFGERWITINGKRYQGEFAPGIPSGIDTGTLVFKNLTIPTVPKGVTVSGTAVSWNNTDNAEYRLYDGSTSDADIKAEWKAGKYTTALAYTPVKGGITLNADGKRHDQTFTFETIPEGNYKLVIFKPGGYLPSITSINVTGGNYLAGTIQLHLLGDVNGDGVIKNYDATMLRKAIAGQLTLTPEEKMRADINQDGALKNYDATQLRNFISGKIPSLI